MPPHSNHFVGSAEPELTPFAKSKRAWTPACANENIKLLKRGKRANARLRRYHVVTSFDLGLINPRKYPRAGDERNVIFYNPDPALNIETPSNSSWSRIIKLQLFITSCDFFSMTQSKSGPDPPFLKPFTVKIQSTTSL